MYDCQGANWAQRLAGTFKYHQGRLHWHQTKIGTWMQANVRNDHLAAANEEKGWLPHRLQSGSYGGMQSRPSRGTEQTIAKALSLFANVHRNAHRLFK